MTPEPFESRTRDGGLFEAGEFFMGRGALLAALRKLASDLASAAIPYAMLGVIALGKHGLLRMTVDLDVLLTPEGLQAFHERFVGRGYAALPGAARTFRAVDSGVRIDVITTGLYPGDGRPKAVRFPNPDDVAVEIDGTRVVNLERFVELKLASGMTAPHRLRDLSDIQDLIRAVRIPAEFADRLDESVWPMFRQLWEEAQTVDSVVDL